MLISLKNFIWKIIRKGGMGPLILRIHPKSALRREGWFRSFYGSAPLGVDGGAIPWWTYSAIHFLEDCLRGDMRVLEFGCGNSTVWLSQRVAKVVSLEKYHIWAVKVRGKAGGNVDIIEVSDYIQHLESRLTDELFDVITIDAKDREKSAVGCLKLLSERGVLVIDDTERPDEAAAVNAVIEIGFRELPFWGVRPQVIHLGKTSIMYRPGNCLGI